MKVHRTPTVFGVRHDSLGHTQKRAQGASCEYTISFAVKQTKETRGEQTDDELEEQCKACCKPCKRLPGNSIIRSRPLLTPLMKVSHHRQLCFDHNKGSIFLSSSLVLTQQKSTLLV